MIDSSIHFLHFFLLFLLLFSIEKLYCLKDKVLVIAYWLIHICIPPWSKSEWSWTVDLLGYQCKLIGRHIWHQSLTQRHMMWIIPIILNFRKIADQFLLWFFNRPLCPFIDFMLINLLIFTLFMIELYFDFIVIFIIFIYGCFGFIRSFCLKVKLRIIL